MRRYSICKVRGNANCGIHGKHYTHTDMVTSSFEPAVAIRHRHIAFEWIRFPALSESIKGLLENSPYQHSSQCHPALATKSIKKRLQPVEVCIWHPDFFFLCAAQEPD